MQSQNSEMRQLIIPGQGKTFQEEKNGKSLVQALLWGTANFLEMGRKTLRTPSQLGRSF